MADTDRNKDRAAEAARFMVENRQATTAEFDATFPGITKEEVSRAIDIAQEVLRAQAAEHMASAEALERELQRRRNKRAATQ